MPILGRPPKYTGLLKRHIFVLVKRYNGQQAMAILNARTGSKLSKLRNLKLVPSALGISLPTIYKITEEGGHELALGRPPLRVAA